MDEDIARMNIGMNAGQALREKMEETTVSPSFGALTVNYVTRTVSIIDRGLAVLSEQKSRAISEVNRVEARQKLLLSRASDASDSLERQTSEEELGEWLMNTTFPRAM